MLEHGFPFVFLYTYDVHDNHVGGSAPCNVISANATCAYGPGEAGYVAALHAYDTAFGMFFSRLAADGITASNTLFIISPDEQDHFGGTQNPTPTGCDGVTTPCTYNHTPTSPSARNVATVGAAHVNVSPCLGTDRH